ncbi:MAG: universal stress protein [Archangium sp.]|nr:universal stress protein [Archangium sp.]
MTIVCATHFSDSSFAAIKAAAALARAHHEPLYLVSVLPTGVLSRARTEQESGDALRLEASALVDSGIQVQTAVLHGPLDSMLQQFCRETEANLLVIGEPRQPAISLFTGPFDALTNVIDIPLLVVRDPEPFEAWATGPKPLKVMLAIDHTWSSARARDWLEQLAEYGALDVVATFVWWPADEYRRRGLEEPPAGDAHEVLSAQLHREVRTELIKLPRNVARRIHLEIANSHVAERLVIIAAVEQVDVLVMGSHPGLGPLARLRSMTHDIIADAPMSVACVPSPVEETSAPVVAADAGAAHAR